ncbi:hypothetical protein [Dankookia sp. P2]|uniref:hypothetical protein n=1 Tax=Dankookia sp. P2 TaxID=3423955 RepID=UPI003D66514E
MEPTAAGRQLLARLTPILDELEAACAALRPEPAAEAAPLALHCVPSFAAQWLGPRLPGFLARHPGITLRLTANADPVDMARQRGSTSPSPMAWRRPSRGGGRAARPGTGHRPGGPGAAGPARPDRPRPAGGADTDRIGGQPGTLGGMAGAEPARPANGVAAPLLRPGGDGDRRGGAGVGVALESTRLAAGELARGELVVLGGGRFRGLPRVLHHLCTRAAQRGVPRIAAFRAWLLEEATTQ